MSTVSNRTFSDAASSVRERPSLSREAIILQHGDLVRTIAKKLSSRIPPCVTVDDLISAGTIGLIHAADKFDPSRKIAFPTYARHRILGAMLDFLREEDPLSRAERHRYQKADALTMSAVTVSLDELPERTLRDTKGSSRRTAFTQILHRELRDARQHLPPRENRVLWMLFDAGWSNRQAAQALGVHESRISQIKSKALSRLRLQFRAAG